jgi:hypothetical protein
MAADQVPTSSFWLVTKEAEDRRRIDLLVFGCAARQ